MSRINKTQEKIIEESRLCREIIEQTVEPILLLDFETKLILRANNALLNLLGYSLEEILKLKIYDIVMAEKSSIDTNIKLIVEEKSFFVGERKYLKKDGAAVDVEVHVNAIAFEGKEVLCATVRDITKRKLAEERLKESEEKYRMIFEKSPVGIFRYDTDLRVTECNDRFADILQSSREKIIGFDMKGLKDRNILPALSEPLSGRDGAYSGFYEATVSPVKIWVSLKTSPFFDKDGITVRGAVGIVEDITDRMLAEDKLRKLSRAVEQSPNVVVITDTTGVIEYVNPKFSQITGYALEEVIGKNPRILKSGKHSSDMYKKLWETINSGDEWKGELCNVKKSGELYWEMSSISPIKNQEGSVTHFIKVAEDITMRKKLEEEMLKATKLESIGMLAGGIAHDFNNILTAIIGNISLAKMKSDSGTGIYKNLLEVEKASVRAQNLTLQLLTFSKGGLPVKKIGSVSSLLKESATFILSGSKLKCEFGIADDLYPVEFDEGQINQVINNIVINSDHAMPNGGIIRIEASNVKIKPQDFLPLKEGKYVKISIADHGIGIPEEYINRIFDPYFTTKQKGSGLGLSISYSIIKNHNGYITVESDVGSGTTFTIYLPASEKTPHLENGKEKESLKGKGTVLLMDDEEIIRDVAGEMLAYLGYKAEFAADGAEVLSKYINAKEYGTPFDLVILDLTIPGGMGGKEAMEKLLEIDPNVRVIVSSGYSNDPVMAEFEIYGFKGAIPKPYKIDELGKMLKSVMKQ